MTKQEQLRAEAQRHRKKAGDLLVASAKLLAEARLLDLGQELTPERIVLEAQGKNYEEPIEVLESVANEDMAKYIRIARFRKVLLVDENGVVGASMFTPRHPLGPGFDLDESEEVGLL